MVAGSRPANTDAGVTMGLNALKRRVLREETSCTYCGDPRRFAMTIDHVVPRVRGGKNTRHNLCACCIRCNLMKEQMTGIEFRMQIAMTGTPWTSDAWCRKNYNGLLQCERKHIRNIRLATLRREFALLRKKDRRRAKRSARALDISCSCSLSSASS